MTLRCPETPHLSSAMTDHNFPTAPETTSIDGLRPGMLAFVGISQWASPVTYQHGKDPVYGRMHSLLMAGDVVMVLAVIPQRPSIDVFNILVLHGEQCFGFSVCREHFSRQVKPLEFPLKTNGLYSGVDVL